MQRLLLVLPLHILLDNVCMHGTNVAVIECLGMRTSLNHKSALKLALIIRMCLRLRAHNKNRGGAFYFLVWHARTISHIWSTFNFNIHTRP
jgi:hypothetical protein